MTDTRKTERKLITPEKTNKIFSLIKDGYSYSEVAKIMGDGMTKNAVSGLVYRNKDRATSIKNIISDIPVKADGINIMDLKNDSCRFPFNGALFCGKISIQNSSYCKEHDKLCVTARTKSRC